MKEKFQDSSSLGFQNRYSPQHGFNTNCFVSNKSKVPNKTYGSIGTTNRLSFAPNTKKHGTYEPSDF